MGPDDSYGYLTPLKRAELMIIWVPKVRAGPAGRSTEIKYPNGNVQKKSGLTSFTVNEIDGA